MKFLIKLNTQVDNISFQNRMRGGINRNVETLHLGWIEGGLGGKIEMYKHYT